MFSNPHLMTTPHRSVWSELLGAWEPVTDAIKGVNPVERSAGNTQVTLRAASWMRHGARRAVASMDKGLLRSTTVLGSVALLGCAMLAACQMPAKEHASPITGNIEPPPMFMDAIKTCRATHAKFLLARTVTRELLVDAQLRTGAQRARTVMPGDATPLLSDENRLLVDTDNNGRAVVVRCG
ncbi:I78 family peptidase inhibitor [Variovorax paradoxus]|uniref:I78 family peptidase inhibitor n=1 Tax=Variovorax paradoxus TaxID=34073 RepID=UPI00277E19C8|nr:I78 family peptidase inhibitor [Variovorax paradoxus]MDP9932862.1 hypothetical protein [Variovorax paradoxus]